MRRDGKWWAPTGTTATTYILKPVVERLPDGVDFSDSVENEYLCMKLTAAFGLATADVEMADFDGRRALVVERFDRRWTPAPPAARGFMSGIVDAAVSQL